MREDYQGHLEKVMQSNDPDSGAYNLFSAIRPGVITVLSRKIKQGHGPREIADFYRTRTRSPFLAMLVELAADYMMSNPDAQ